MIRDDAIDTLAHHGRHTDRVIDGPDHHFPVLFVEMFDEGP